MNLSDRKKQLIAQGAVYRAEALHAKLAAQGGLRAGPLLQGAAGRLAAGALTLYRNRAAARLLGAGMSKGLPLLASGIGLLAGGGRWKRGLRLALAAGGLAAAVRFIARRKPSTAGVTSMADVANGNAAEPSA